MEIKAKKIIAVILISFLFLLSACSGGNNQNNDLPKDKTKTYETNYISLSYPQDWEVIENKDFPAGTPPSTIVILTANVKNELFITNINIAHNILPQAIDSTDYAKQVIANQKATLQNYNELSREEVSIQIGGKPAKAIMAIFEGKRLATDPVIRFIQLYAVKDTQAYIATASMLPTEEEYIQNAAKNVVKSLNIK